MLLVESKLVSRLSDYSILFDEIDRGIAALSNRLYNSKRYRTEMRKCDLDRLIKLSDYREILQFKIMCDACLKDWSLSAIATQIRKLTNSIL